MATRPAIFKSRQIEPVNPSPLCHIVGSIRLTPAKARVPVCNVLVRTDTIWRRAKQNTIDLKALQEDTCEKQYLSRLHC